MAQTRRFQNLSERQNAQMRNNLYQYRLGSQSRLRRMLAYDYARSQKAQDAFYAKKYKQGARTIQLNNRSSDIRSA